MATGYFFWPGGVSGSGTTGMADQVALSSAIRLAKALCAG